MLRRRDERLFFVRAQPELGVLAGDEAAGSGGLEANLDRYAGMVFGSFAGVRASDGKMFYRDFASRAGSSLILSGFFLHKWCIDTCVRFLIESL